MALPPVVRLLLCRVASGLVLLRLRLVISVASAVSAVSVDPMPDQRLSLVLMQVSDLALLRLRPVASAALALLRLRPVASAALPLADLAISEASADLAGLATLPLLVPLRSRRLASDLAQHLFLPLGSVLPASLRLRS